MSLVLLLDLLRREKGLTIENVEYSKVLLKGVPQRITVTVRNNLNMDLLGFLRLKLFRNVDKILDLNDVKLFKPGLNKFNYSLKLLDVGEYVLDISVGLYKTPQLTYSSFMEDKLMKMSVNEEKLVKKSIRDRKRIKLVCQSI